LTRKKTTILIWALLLGIVLLALLSRVTERDSDFADADGSVQANDGRFDMTNLVTTLLIVVVVLVAVFYFLRRLQGTSVNSVFELRKTKARVVEQDNKARFADIGGNQQAVDLLADIVDFFHAPERWTNAGLRIPRGVLVVGPPGTGKTLLARAVAGETQSAFFYTSATEFVEMFVGIGAARIRDTFEKALAQQPAIIFIDELDAIGRRRGSGTGTIHEEREQTLNQLLVLLDGVEQHKRVLVMAATNRPDVLDAALMRPGRFDRVLRLELPSQSERLDILKIHTRNKPLAPSLSLDRVAEQTANYAGADLESLTNAAGLHAVRRTRKADNHAAEAVAITNDDFDRAREEMTKSNRLFNRLDSVLVESVSQFSEPTGRAVARVTFASGNTVEGEVQWMNATHIKLCLSDGSEVIISKESAVQIASIDGADSIPQADFLPDRWAGRSLDVG
jgi:ATP-dependent metalloprotease FtsH